MRPSPTEFPWVRRCHAVKWYATVFDHEDYGHRFRGHFDIDVKRRKRDNNCRRQARPYPQNSLWLTAFEHLASDVQWLRCRTRDLMWIIVARSPRDQFCGIFQQNCGCLKRSSESHRILGLNFALRGWTIDQRCLIIKLVKLILRLLASIRRRF